METVRNITYALASLWFAVSLILQVWTAAQQNLIERSRATQQAQMATQQVESLQRQLEDARKASGGAKP